MIRTTTSQVLTPEQQKRLGELMMRDIRSNLGRQERTGELRSMTALTFNPLHTAPVVGAESVDEMLGRIEQEQKEREERRELADRRHFDTLFNREELFRYAYVPFVIAELVWDYADTVIIMAQRLRDPSARRLSRAIRQARAEYDRTRRRFIDAEHREREVENGYVFEELTKRITAQMMLNVRLDIQTEYPQLNEESRELLQAVYQCHITSRALLRYLEQQTAEVSKRVGHRVGRMLPPPYYVMDKLIPAFIGDKPASPQFRKLMDDYIKTFATQIALVELNDIAADKDEKQNNAN